jgi:hypothetical protein
MASEMQAPFAPQNFKILQQKMQKHSRQKGELDIQWTVHRDIFL